MIMTGHICIYNELSLSHIIICMYNTYRQESMMHVTMTVSLGDNRGQKATVYVQMENTKCNVVFV